MVDLYSYGDVLPIRSYVCFEVSIFIMKILKLPCDLGQSTSVGLGKQLLGFLVNPRYDDGLFKFIEPLPDVGSLHPRSSLTSEGPNLCGLVEILNLAEFVSSLFPRARGLSHDLDTSAVPPLSRSE